MQDPLCQSAICLDELWIVEQYQRLQRRVRNGSRHRAHLSIGRVECYHRWWWHRAFPKRVHTATIQFLAVALDEYLRRRGRAAEVADLFP